jgi:hypothetical protein
MNAQEFWDTRTKSQKDFLIKSCCKIKFSKSHKLNKDWVYFDTKTAHAFDTNYKSNWDSHLGFLLTEASSSYCYETKETYTKGYELKKDNFKSLWSIVKRQIKPMHFVNSEKKESKLLKMSQMKTKWSTVAKLDSAFHRKLEHYKSECLKIEDENKAKECLDYLFAMSLYVNGSGELHTTYVKRGERMVATSQSLQGCPKELRNILLKGSHYCDIDAKQSYNYDFSHLLTKYRDELTHNEYMILECFLGKNSRKGICSAYGLTKADHLALMFGHQKNKAKIECFDELTKAREKFTKILYSKSEGKDLQDFNKNPKQWTQKDYGKCLSRIMNRLETQKIELYAKALTHNGYQIQSYQFDGMILNKEISPKNIEKLNEWFSKNHWESPLEVKTIWN